MGFKDFGITLVYILAIAATLLSVVYSIVNWNKGAEETLSKDWHEEENEINKEIGED